MFTMKMKKFFFDAPKVMAMVAKKERDALSRFGAFVQRRARTSLRRRKKVSAAGSTPSIHSENPDASLKKILFAYDPNAGSVIIGPVKLNMVGTHDGVIGPGTLPALMEYGGTSEILEVQYHDGTWRRADKRSRRRIAAMPQRVRTANYAARPFMGPALKAESEAGTMDRLWG